MATQTPNFSFSLPEAGFDKGTWGGFLNGNWTAADTQLASRMTRDMLKADGTADAFSAPVSVSRAGTAMLGMTNTGVAGTALLSVEGSGAIGLTTAADIGSTTSAVIEPSGPSVISGQAVITYEKLVGALDFLALNVLTRQYPVGALYLSTVATNPSVLLGFGTWVAHAAGRALVGVGTADGNVWVGGSEKGNTNVTLTVAQMPTHSHSVNAPSYTASTAAASAAHTHIIDAPSTTFTTANGGVNHTHSVDAPATSVVSGTNSVSHAHSTNVASTESGTTSSHSHVTSTRFMWVNEGLSGTTYKAMLTPDVTHGNSYTSNTTANGANHTHFTDPAPVTSGAQSLNHTHTSSVNIPAFNSAGASSYLHAHTVAVNLPAFTSASSSSTSHSHSFTVDLPAFNSASTGSGDAHSNVQPSIGVYVWQRAA
jgi:microcystin-dependent protein|tara:strand:+ start:3860 stop:5137 length:1278 start_codon:yes stop_codon:yes gene_type:complete